MSKVVHVLCRHDALYAAIELKLSSLPQLHVVRLESDPVEQPSAGRLAVDADLIIVAPVPPVSDPLALLARASLLGCVGRVPLLIISEQPSQSQAENKITYLNFPFDLDDLTQTVADILGERQRSAVEHSEGR